MDAKTVAAYDERAPEYCDEWLGQPPAQDIQALWEAFLLRGRATVDVGSGSGRDADWLTRHGYPCDGIDVSRGLIDEARRRFPSLGFRAAALPALEGVPDAAYSNVVCETVIMHLPVHDIVPAVRSLERILAPGGVLYLSWRVTAGGDRRDDAGRLYASFDAQAVRDALASSTVLYDREEISVSSAKRVHRLIARRPAG